MSVVAKFYVSNVERPEGSSTASKIDMQAVCRGVENAAWASATPGGNMTLWSLNDNATEYFERGCEYEIHFLKVAKPEPGDGHKARPVKSKYGQYVCATCGAIPQCEKARDNNWQWNGITTEDLDWTHHDEMYSPSPTE
jgi:hypothetical protein